jgi:DNA-binding beta-propeller fold protein YncE
VKVWDAATGQEIRTLTGHAGFVTSVAYSPDGRRLASAGFVQTVKVWDAGTWQEILTLRGHTNSVYSVAYSPDGRRLASASLDRTVQLWDTATGQEIRTLTGHMNSICSVAFSPDGQRLASASEDGTVKLWDAATGQEIRTLTGHTNSVCSVAFSPDGRRLASASWDRTVKLWDAGTWQEILTLKGHTNLVRSVAFSLDGQRLASASDDQTVKHWDATPLTPESRAWDEALGLLRFLLERVASEAELRDRILGDQTIAPATRATALKLAESFWATRIRQQAQSLNNAAWELVKLPNRPEADFRRGLRLAKDACQLQPNDGLILNTLGVAQYRTGQYEKAQATLTRSNQVNRNLQPADLAFLAMTQHRLHQVEAARATLQRFRAVMKDPEVAANGENQGFLREAETVILNLPELPDEVFAP